MCSYQTCEVNFGSSKKNKKINKEKQKEKKEIDG